MKRYKRFICGFLDPRTLGDDEGGFNPPLGSTRVRGRPDGDIAGASWLAAEPSGEALSSGLSWQSGTGATSDSVRWHRIVPL